jgi:DNA-binding MarR family transcriptional regulator
LGVKEANIVGNIHEDIRQKKFNNEYHKLFINLFFTGSWLHLKSIQHFKAYGISPQQYNILRILRGQLPNPCSILSISERMIDKNSNASRLVEKLRQKKLVQRQTNLNDRRAVEVSITEEGLKLLLQMDIEEEKMLAELSTLDEAEAKLLNELLDKLRG